MAQNQSFDRYGWQRSLHSTMPKLLREIEDASKRNYAMMALLESAGRISLGHGGEGLKWNVMYRNHAVSSATGLGSRNFVATNQFKQAALDYRGYECTDSIKRREAEKNRGEAAIIKILDGFSERLKQSMMQALGPQFYVDGNDAAASESWHGLKTLAKTNGETITTSGKRTKDQADKVADATAVYADLNCALGSYGGSQEANVAWPEGIQNGQGAYDFWTPLVVVRDSTSFSGSTTGEKLEKAIRYGLTHGQRNSSIDSQITNVFMDRQLFVDLKDFNDGRQTIEVKSAPGSLVDLGFRNVIRLDGVELSAEHACTSGFAYGVNINAIELMGMTDNLLELDGPEYDINTQSLNVAISTLSNLKFQSPRNFCIWKPFSAV